MAGIEVSNEQRPGYEAFGKALHTDGVGAKAGNAALAWLFQTRQRGGPPEDAKHTFTYNAGHFEPRDAPYLTSSEREALESERNADGVAALNDPKRLRELIELARGGRKAAPQKSPADEREEIERVMREDRGRYNRDERMQARYRDLLRGATPTNGKPAPQGGAGIDAEIAKLEGKMRSDRTAWFRDEVSQARLRKLYAARDGG